MNKIYGRVLWCPRTSNETCLNLDPATLLCYLSFLLRLGMIYGLLGSCKQCNLCSNLAIPLIYNEEGPHTECFRAIQVDIMQVVKDLQVS